MSERKLLVSMWVIPTTQAELEQIVNRLTSDQNAIPTRVETDYLLSALVELGVEASRLREPRLYSGTLEDNVIEAAVVYKPYLDQELAETGGYEDLTILLSAIHEMVEARKRELSIRENDLVRVANESYEAGLKHAIVREDMSGNATLALKDAWEKEHPK